MLMQFAQNNALQSIFDATVAFAVSLQLDTVQIFNLTSSVPMLNCVVYCYAVFVRTCMTLNYYLLLQRVVEPNLAFV